MRTGYFWLTMKQDAQDFVRKCTSCQEFANFKHTPNSPLANIMSPWIHAVWGLDLIGQLPTAKGQLKYIIVAVDYFSKWVEAEALACISTTKITRFLWKNVYCRYGVPQTIITDNGTQFNNPEFISFARDLGTTVRFASVAHPQANGQVEAVNKKIMQLLKRSLGDAKGLWAEKLPEVLWALRTTPTEATGRTPFSLMFGSECVLPIEQALPSARVIEFDEVTNDISRRLDLDLLEEDRVAANIRNLEHKQRVARFYNARVREKQFYLGDLVMKRIIPPPAKLRPQWEGPFQITEVLSKGAYRLSTLGGKELHRSWNAQYLKDCYKE